RADSPGAARTRPLRAARSQVLRVTGGASNDTGQSPIAHPIILYNGVCGLCNRLNQFVLIRDPDGIFRFASFQSEFAVQVLTHHCKDARDLNTLYVILNHGQPDESLLSRSDAVIYILRKRGGIWNVTSALMRLMPKSLRDWGYGVVARNRYRVFGRYETCMLP